MVASPLFLLRQLQKTYVLVKNLDEAVVQFGRGHVIERVQEYLLFERVVQRLVPRRFDHLLIVGVKITADLIRVKHVVVSIEVSRRVTH